MTLVGVYQASCGQILMKIGGHQAGAFPDLPIQLRDPDLSRKTQFIDLNIFFSPIVLKSENCFILLNLVLKFECIGIS